MFRLRMTVVLGLGLGLVCAPGLSRAQPPAGAETAVEPQRLAEGQTAPALDVQEWLVGPPVLGVHGGRVCVVEFGASWCPASRKAIGVLARAHQAHAGSVTIVGVLGDDGREETRGSAAAFAQSQGSTIPYSVGFDRRRNTARAWMDAAEQTLIPTAFIVDRAGVIAWIGNPIWPPGEFEDALGQVVVGKFGPVEREATRRRWADHRERVGALESAVEQADMEGQPERAIQALDSLIALNVSGAGAYALRKFTILLQAKDPEPAYRFGRWAVDGPLKDDAEALNELAWTVLEDEAVSKRDIALAHRAAERAVELTAGRDGAILDTLARAWRERGDLDKAVEFQTKAVEAARQPAERAQFAEMLDEYRLLRSRRLDR